MNATLNRTLDLLAGTLSNLSHQPNGDIIALLRTASTLMEQRKAEISRGEMLFPGWDFDHIKDAEGVHRQREIREAAYVILGRDNCDAAQTVPTENVAALVHYIADMMEE